MPVFRTSDYLWRAPLKFGSGAWGAVVPSPPPPPPPPPPPAVTLTLSGPSSGATGVAASFSVSPSGPLVAAITVPLGATNGAALSVPTLTFASGATAAQSFTVTRATDGTSSVSMTNDGGLTNIGTPISFVSSTSVAFVVQRPALLGQSNMQNGFSAHVNFINGATANSDYWDGSAWHRVGYTLSPTMTGDAIVLLADSIVTSTGAPSHLLPYAVGGSNIASWQPGTGANWATFAAGLSGSGGICNAAIWYLGETDAGSLSIAAYKAQARNVHDGLLAATGLTAANFRFGLVALGPCTPSWRAEGSFGPIRQAQLEYVAENAGAYLVGHTMDMSLSDGVVHLTGAGYIRLYRRIAWFLTGKDTQGPKIASASRVGAVVTVQISHNGGTSLADGAGGAGSALQGFRVFDGATLMTINSTAISGSTIVLTLSSTPSGAVTLDYGALNAPFGSTVSAASVVYDNQTVPGDTLGIPLQPKPTISVT